MIKVMIVDDEPLQRQYIRSILEKHKNQYKIVGEAVDGEDALDLARSLKPDIMLMDIKMPGIDGMEVAKILRPAIPNCRIIIITAYGEFHYAKEAVTLGVAEYILKPVDEEELTSLLARLSVEIEEERQKEYELDSMKATLTDVLPLIKAGFVMDLINGYLSDENEMNNRAAFLGVNSPLRVAINVWIDNMGSNNNFRSELERQIVQRQVGELINKTLLDWPENFMVPIGNGQFAMVLAAPMDVEDSLLKELSIKLCSKICDTVRDNSSATVTIGIGRPAHGPAGIARSQREALAAGEYRILYGGDQPIHADDVEASSEYANVLKQGYEKNLVMAVCMGDWERTMRSFLSLWTEYINDGVSQPVRIRMKLSEICTIVTRSAVESGIELEVIEESRAHLEAQLDKEHSSEAIKEKVVNWLNDLVSKIRASREFRNVNLIDKAVRYMEDNYHQEIGLDDVAKQVYLSTCYFSRLFKQVKGWSFTEYLTHVRMEEARKLLANTDYSVAEIAMRVGYRDARYFSQVFKKHVNKTPGSYRRDEAGRNFGK